MLTIISTALGFFTSLVPNVLDYFKQKRDQDHELAMIDAQTQAQLAIGQMQLEATVTDAQLKEIQAAHKEQASTAVAAGRFISGLSASVRPVVTYLFVLEFLAINWAIAWLTFDANGFTIEALRTILDDRFFSLLSSMIAFWFGNRTFGKRRT
jgi:hypothetical protein